MPSAQVTITQLPAAGAITGTEAVPIVQNGQTVQTTTGAIAASPNQTQTFVTVNQEPTLPNSRSLSGNTGVTVTDNGAQSTLQVSLTGAPASLVTSTDGLQSKSGATMVGRTIVPSTGVSVTNGNGVSGNPTIGLTGAVGALAGLAGTGILGIVSGSSVTSVQITGTTDEIDVANGTGPGNPTIGIADNAQMPGTGAMKVPSGTTAQRTGATDGQLRYNTDTNSFEGLVGGSWVTALGASGISGFSGYSGFSGFSGISGFSGFSGISGFSGSSGVSSTFYPYRTNTGSTSGNPGTGKLLWNNGTQTSATQINVNHITDDGFDIDVFLALLADTEVFIIQDAGNSANFQKWEINGTPTNQTNYWELPCTLLDSGGTGTSGFADDLEVILAVVNGISGFSGYSGFSGFSGFSGDSGISGFSGESGTSGFSGESGASGISGFSGFSGESGASGISGFSGQDGQSGFSGESGFSGFSGESGISGFSGFSGESGASGISGFSGESGASGFSGFSGQDGQSGFSGFSGFSGYSGIDGTAQSGESGYSGYSGFSGFSGQNGASGASGYSGFSGQDGASGFSGFSGISGFSGFSGTSGFSGAPPTQITVTTTSASTLYPTLVTGTSGSQSVYADAGFTYDASTNAITAGVNGGTF